MSNQYIYFDGDDINCIYFFQKGEAGYVLPRHQNVMYIYLDPGEYFGITCIIGSFMEGGESFSIETWLSYKDKLKR